MPLRRVRGRFWGMFCSELGWSDVFPISHEQHLRVQLEVGLSLSPLNAHCILPLAFRSPLHLCSSGHVVHATHVFQTH